MRFAAVDESLPGPELPDPLPDEPRPPSEPDPEPLPPPGGQPDVTSPIKDAAAPRPNQARA